MFQPWMLLAAALALISASAPAADYALSWTVTDPSGISEFAIGSRVDGVAYPVEYTGGVGTARTVARTAAPGQVLEFYVSACSPDACGPWGPGATLAASVGAPAGTVQTTTVTSIRIDPPALP